MRSRLRSATGELHAALEARLDLTSPQLSIERYGRVLIAFHGYYRAIEPRLVALAKALRVSLPIVTRTVALERDLISLGLSHDAIAAGSCEDLPPLRRLEHLAGCLYVLEGSRLGGAVIARAVGQHLGLTSERGCSFFAGRDEPEKRWPEVVAWLERVATEEAVDPYEIVDASAATFRSLGSRLAAVGALL